MAKKKDLLKMAADMGLDVDASWTKKELESAIAQHEQELSPVPVESNEDEVTDPVEETLEEPIVEPDIVDTDVVVPPVFTPPSTEAPKEENKPTTTAPVVASKPDTTLYRCVSNLTYLGQVYTVDDTISLPDTVAKPHLEHGSIVLASNIDADIERKSKLPAGEYELEYGITLRGKAYDLGTIVTLTAEEAERFDALKAIKPRS